MDPLTILATAKAATAGIQQAIKIGRSVHDIVKEVSALMNANGQLAKLAADPPKGWGQKQSAEELALQAFTARKETERMQQEVQNLIVSEWGIKAWDEIQKEIIAIRKAQKEAALKAAKERAEKIQLYMIAVPAIGIPLAIIIIILVALWRYS